MSFSPINDNKHKMGTITNEQQSILAAYQLLPGKYPVCDLLASPINCCDRNMTNLAIPEADSRSVSNLSACNSFNKHNVHNMCTSPINCDRNKMYMAKQPFNIRTSSTNCDRRNTRKKILTTHARAGFNLYVDTSPCSHFRFFWPIDCTKLEPGRSKFGHDEYDNNLVASNSDRRTASEDNLRQLTVQARLPTHRNEDTNIDICTNSRIPVNPLQRQLSITKNHPDEIVANNKVGERTETVKSNQVTDSNDESKLSDEEFYGETLERAQVENIEGRCLTIEQDDHELRDGAAVSYLRLCRTFNLINVVNRSKFTEQERLRQQEQQQHVVQFVPDDLQCLETLGGGTFGVVYKVVDTQTDNVYACKEILRMQGADQQKRQWKEVYNEICSLKDASEGSFIMQYWGYCHTDTSYFIFTGNCSNGTMRTILSRNGALSEEIIRMWLPELVRAIAWLHSLGFLHRDIKPANTLIDEQGHIKIADFGLVVRGITSSTSGSTDSSGTPFYQSPEVLGDEPHGLSIDWWALGIMLMEMFSGVNVCNRSVFSQLLRRGGELPVTMDSPLICDANISEEAKDLLRGMLHLNPAARLGSKWLMSDARYADDIKRHPFLNGVDWDRAADVWQQDV